MFSPLRNRFGIPGVISVIALVFAMLGGAYAANDSGGGRATASAKGKQGPRGKTGKTGPAGPAGPAGANGKDGANGSNGSNGQDGAAGAAGAAGTSVTNTSLPLGNEKCAFGGTQFKVGSGAATFACNGEEGAQGEKGEKGDPWAVGGTLPPGATETGTWAFNASDANETIFVPISFTIQVGAEVFEEEGHAHFQSDENFSNTCHGFPGEPSAPPPGELCVYYNNGEIGTGLGNATFQGIGNAGSPFSSTPGPTGAVIRFGFDGEPGEGAFGFGSWAVTGCSDALPVGDPNKCP